MIKDTKYCRPVKAKRDECEKCKRNLAKQIITPGYNGVTDFSKKIRNNDFCNWLVEVEWVIKKYMPFTKGRIL